MPSNENRLKKLLQTWKFWNANKLESLDGITRTNAFGLLQVNRLFSAILGELFSSDFSATEIGMTSVKLVDKFCSEFSWTCCSFYALKFVSTILSNGSIFCTCRQWRRRVHVRGEYKGRTGRSNWAPKAPAINIEWTVFKWQLSVSEC